MKFNFKIISILFNILLTIFVFYTLSKRIPSVVEHFQMEDQSLPNFSVPLIDGSTLTSQAWAERKILVFWATWCGPCEVELNRLNKMIENGKIKTANSVVAISSYEEIPLVKGITNERGYKFSIGIDLKGSVAEKFKIAGTPTIIFVDENAKINWITTGLSPSLEMRANSFLNP